MRLPWTEGCDSLDAAADVKVTAFIQALVRCKGSRRSVLSFEFSI